MTKENFEAILDKSCEQLTHEARTAQFKSSPQFENRVRETLDALTRDDKSFRIDFAPHPQAFPDIAMGEFGVEVKFTLNDTWRSVANSVLETQRIETVKHIYIIFGKMGGLPEVRWGHYEQSVIHVRTSHVPRFEIELPTEKATVRQSLFEEMGIQYDDFRKFQMQEKMKYIRAYARKIHPDGRLWWIEEKESDEHTMPIQARLYTNLTMEEKTRLRAEAALLCPKIVDSGRSRNKYDDMVLYLLTYHGVLCHQARDLFSAGSVANPKNDDDGGIYVERALKMIEAEMCKAAMRMDDALFVEYWGESVLPEKRIARWLEKADEYAKGWKPSGSLFLGESPKELSDDYSSGD
ncbi:MAG: restriction endonuclease [Kiritimatiellaeota bacterium]|nr:restriction endonuclease [Kiritimatiellota bacterium]